MNLPKTILLTFMPIMFYWCKAQYNFAELDFYKTAGVQYEEIGQNLVVDSLSNIYIVGSFENTMDFDPGPNITVITPVQVQSGIFWGKYDSIGNFSWVNALDSNIQRFTFNDRSIDSFGNIYVTGEFLDTVDFDFGPDTLLLKNASPSPRIFVAKYNQSGSIIWAFALPSSFPTVGYNGASKRILVRGEYIYIVGEVGGPIAFDPSNPQSLTFSSAYKEMFFAKYDTSSNYIFGKSTQGSWPSEVAVHDAWLDRNSNLLISGHYEHAIDFDPSPLTVMLSTLNSPRRFTAKYDSSGNYYWANPMNVQISPFAINFTNFDMGTSFIRSDSLNNIWVLHEIFTNQYSSGYFNAITGFDPQQGNPIPGIQGSHLPFDYPVGQPPYLYTGQKLRSFVVDSIGVFSVLFNDEKKNAFLTVNGGLIYRIRFTTGQPPQIESLSLYPAPSFSTLEAGPFVVDLELRNHSEIWATGWTEYIVDFDPTDSTQAYQSVASSKDLFFAKYKLCKSPTIFVDTSDVEICEGVDTFFVATYAGDSSSISWQHNSNPIQAIDTIWIYGATLADSGIYVATATGLCGNPSSDTLRLRIIPTPVTPLLVVSNDTLSVTAQSTNYIWLFNGVPTGANSPFLVMDSAGNYSLILETNGCQSDTSQPYMFSGLAKTDDQIVPLEIYPNPNSGTLSLRINSFAPNIRIRCFDSLGNQVPILLENHLNQNGCDISFPDPISGIYWLEVQSGGRRAIEKISIQL